MSEKVPSIEGEPRLTKENVANRLRENPEDFSSLNDFLEQRESEVRDSRDGLRLIVDKAWAIEASGNFPSAAEDDYLAAAEQAWQEGLDDLSDELRYRASAVAGPPAPRGVRENE
jgi:hypothetical protein